MEVSMLRLAWLPIAQHVFQPALTGRLELISRKIVSSEQEQRLSRWEDFAKNCLPQIECKELPRFREKYHALGVPRLQNSRNRWAKKWGPTCDRDISNSAIYTTAIYRAYFVYGFYDECKLTEQCASINRIYGFYDECKLTVHLYQYQQNIWVLWWM